MLETVRHRAMSKGNQLQYVNASGIYDYFAIFDFPVLMDGTLWSLFQLIESRSADILRIVISRALVSWSTTFTSHLQSRSLSTL